MEKEILPEDPFAVIDRDGVGLLMKMAVEKGRAVRPDMECGICGEHGGDPESIQLCHELGLTYVSCSPFRIPVARLATAHAALREKNKRLTSILNDRYSLFNYLTRSEGGIV